MDVLDVRLACLKADDGFRKAMKEIRKLARDGRQTDESEEALCLYAYLAVRPKESNSRRTPKERWEEVWGSGTSKKWKALTEFPDRIRKISAEVTSVSGSAFFDPQRAIRGKLAPWADFSYAAFSGRDGHFVNFAKEQFRLLPVTLKLYADWLEVQIKGISALGKHFYRRKPRKHSLFIHEVSNEVNRITGRVCDRQVADLLNAADRAMNPAQKRTDDRFDEQTIALLRSRQKRKRAKT